MTIKKFRAATMREALEQVKHELGDEALVLDTKRVRAGSVLGLGGYEQIEVRVSTDTHDTKSSEAKPAAARHNFLQLDDEASRPVAASRHPLIARHAYAQAADSASLHVETNATAVQLESNLTSNVEFASNVELAAPTASSSNFVAAHTTIESNARHTSFQSGELDLLRAELREVKFSLSMLPARFAAAQVTPRDATNEIYDSPYYEAFLELTALGLSADLARRAVSSVAQNPMHEAATSSLAVEQAISEIVRQSVLQLAAKEINFAIDPFATSHDSNTNASNSNAAAVIALVGATGVGKTTTIAKLAARVALRERRQVELITLDTYRIAGVEQLKTYAEIIGAGCHVARSVLELEAMVNRFSNTATVLIDTVGRSPHDLSDQLELADYLRASHHITRCLVLQATTHPADALDTRRKFALYGVDSLCLTKLDETARPAAALDMLIDARLPALYLCAGQRVPEDLELASADSLLARIVR